MSLGFAVVYALRVNLSVAMVVMVNTTDPEPAKNGSVFHACPLQPGMENTSDHIAQPAGVTQFKNIFIIKISCCQSVCVFKMKEVMLTLQTWEGESAGASS